MTEVLCGKCKARAEVVAGAGREDEAVCLLCGQRDTVDDAISIAREQLADAAARVLQGNREKAMRDNPFDEFDARPLPPRTFKWHAF